MRFIVSKKPKEYLKQGPTGCGAFSVKGILSAYDKDDKAHPFQYLPLSVIPFVTTAPHWVTVLRSYGLSAHLQSLRYMADTQRIDTLKGFVSHNTPIMLYTGNGYRGNGIWSRIRWQMIGHWITLWGFDDEKGYFYIYDSAVPLRYHNKTIPIGNVARTYRQVARDIRGGQPWWRRYRFIRFAS
jgi:hypothetical protein